MKRKYKEASTKLGIDRSQPHCTVLQNVLGDGTAAAVCSVYLEKRERDLLTRSHVPFVNVCPTGINFQHSRSCLNVGP